MSRISKVASKMVENQKLKPKEMVKNFMGGISYKLDPIQTLKMIAASSIFGEPSYYRYSQKQLMLHSITTSRPYSSLLVN